MPRKKPLTRRPPASADVGADTPGCPGAGRFSLYAAIPASAAWETEAEEGCETKFYPNAPEMACGAGCTKSPVWPRPAFTEQKLLSNRSLCYPAR